MNVSLGNGAPLVCCIKLRGTLLFKKWRYLVKKGKNSNL